MNEKRDIKEILACNLAKLRKRKRFTQEEFAEKISMSLSGYSDIETANSYPKYETIAKIIEVLGVEPYELFVDPKVNFKAKNYENILVLLKNIKDNEAKVAIILEFIKLVELLP